MTQLRITAEHRGGSVVVTIAGNLDYVSGSAFDDSLKDARQAARWIILDLSGVEFIDTSALAVIVRHWREAADAGGALVLAGARYEYTRALWITGLSRRLAMYDDVDQALAAGPHGTA